MARKGITKTKFSIPYLKIILLSGIVSLLYFFSAFAFASDTGPMWLDDLYYPIIMAAFLVGYSGGSDNRLYSYLAVEWIIFWILLFCLFMIIRFFINLIRKTSQ